MAPATFTRYARGDATFTFDEILGNTTELPLPERTTDSHGQTLATLAMFDLVGRRLSPRIAKATEKQQPVRSGARDDQVQQLGLVA